MWLYLDANAITYAVEAIAPFRNAVIARILQAEQSSSGLIITSRLSRLECRVKPVRDEDAASLATYDAFFSRRLLRLAEITEAVIERATEFAPATDSGLPMPFISRRRLRNVPTPS